MTLQISIIHEPHHLHTHKHSQSSQEVSSVAGTQEPDHSSHSTNQDQAHSLLLLVLGKSTHFLQFFSSQDMQDEDSCDSESESVMDKHGFTSNLR